MNRPAWAGGPNQRAGLPPGLQHLFNMGQGPYRPGGPMAAPIQTARTMPAMTPMSTDTVNARLTPGEGVLNVGAMAMPGMRQQVDAANAFGAPLAAGVAPQVAAALPSWANILAGGPMNFQSGGIVGGLSAADRALAGLPPLAGGTVAPVNPPNATTLPSGLSVPTYVRPIGSAVPNYNDPTFGPGTQILNPGITNPNIISPPLSGLPAPMPIAPRPVAPAPNLAGGFGPLPNMPGITPPPPPNQKYGTTLPRLPINYYGSGLF
jgi:hypothetical protein